MNFYKLYFCSLTLRNTKLYQFAVCISTNKLNFTSTFYMYTIFIIVFF